MNKRSGQVIILTVLILGGTLLAAASVAGLLITYQLRQTADMGTSARAIFAADSGIEWSLYKIFNPENTATTTLTNGTTVQITCFKGTERMSDCENIDEITSVQSIGTAGNTSRAFRLSF